MIRRNLAIAKTVNDEEGTLDLLRNFGEIEMKPDCSCLRQRWLAHYPTHMVFGIGYTEPS